MGRDGADPLFLQMKEATHSVLEPFVPGFEYEHQGERVVHGQRLMQAASDLFLAGPTTPTVRTATTTCASCAT